MEKSATEVFKPISLWGDRCPINCVRRLPVCSQVMAWVAAVLMVTGTLPAAEQDPVPVWVLGSDRRGEQLAAPQEAGGSRQDEFVEIVGAGGSRQRWKGWIVEFTSAGLVLQLGDGTERHFPAEKVAAYSPNTLEECRKAGEAIREGRIADAVALLVRARSVEPREWRRREITAQLVRCLHALGDYRRAGSEFVTEIILPDGNSPFRSCVPLAWFPEDSLSSAEALARTWLGEDSPWVRLLGASYLLTGPHGSQAAAVLERLRLASDRTVAILASAQLWRRTWQVARPDDLVRWETGLDGLPGELKAGPYYVLGTAWAFRSQREKALLCFLRPPYLWPENRRVAARCLWEAAQLLNAAGAGQRPTSEEDISRTRHRNTVLEELVRKFPESPWAARVPSLLSPPLPAKSEIGDPAKG